MADKLIYQMNKLKWIFLFTCVSAFLLSLNAVDEKQSYIVKEESLVDSIKTYRDISCSIDFCNGNEECCECKATVESVDASTMNLRVEVMCEGQKEVKEFRVKNCEILSGIMVINNAERARINAGRIENEAQKELTDLWPSIFSSDFRVGSYVKCLNCYEEVVYYFNSK